MATAADRMSGASFVQWQVEYTSKVTGCMALLVGWTGGYVLVASLLAPYLRKFGCYSSRFYRTRYGETRRLSAVIVLTVASL